MGEGLYRTEGGHTVYVEPFEAIAEGDDDARTLAWDRLHEDLRVCVTRHWRAPERERWRDRAVVVMESMVYELTLHEDSYARVHVSVLVRQDLDDNTEATARAMIGGLDRPGFARFFFRRLAEHYALRRRTTAWTSVPYDPRQQEAPPP